MTRITVLLVLLFAAFSTRLTAQDEACSTLGQNPQSSFPVCGSQEFLQSEVPLCAGRQLPSPCNQPEIKDVNPYWYKFTCFSEGTFGFLIDPEDDNDDYDWQLYDITGHDVSEIYQNDELVVACNWSGRVGVTGATVNGKNLVECIGDEAEIYSAMPTLVAGHEYLLLVSHFTNSQSGYALTFTGGTADITDPEKPAAERAYGSCKGNEVYVKLNKKMKCSSIAKNGSDFSISGGTATITGARSAACDQGFNTDSIVLSLDNVLPRGTYTVNIKAGSDLNTLLDNCDAEMGPTSLAFTMHEDVSAEFTYQISSGCATDTVYFAHDGAHSVNRWNWVFDESLSAEQNPVIRYSTSGTKNAKLIVSNDHCTDTASLSFDLPSRINAAFIAPEIICAADPAAVTNMSTGNIASYRWNFGEGTTSASPQPEPFKYPFGSGEKKYTISLEVTDDKGCTDVANANIVVVGNCNIAVPSAFTPNGDGRNDELYPSNAFNADNLLFRVYNRFGQVVFETRDWRRKWDGRLKGQPAPSGVYIWTLNYVLRATGKSYQFRGTTLLVR